MPVITPPTNSPYDRCFDILNTVRVMLNDRLPSLYPTGATILDNSNAFVQQAFNTGWRKFQSRVSDLGINRLNKEIVIEGLPIVASTDPASQTYMDWFQFFDGVNFSTTPVLPDDFMFPLWISERVTEMNAIFPVTPNMENMVGGMPGWQKWQCNRYWQWRDDKIYMPGSLQSMDLRIGYAAFLPDFVDIGRSRWYTLPVPIMRCLEPLAYYVCYQFCIARAPGDPKLQQAQAAAAAFFRAEAEAATDMVFRRDVQQNQNTNVRRIPQNRGARNGGGWGQIS